MIGQAIVGPGCHRVRNRVELGGSRARRSGSASRSAGAPAVAVSARNRTLAVNGEDGVESLSKPTIASMAHLSKQGAAQAATARSVASPGRHEQADAAARASEDQCALQEELVAVDVPVADVPVDAGVAGKAGERARRGVAPARDRPVPASSARTMSHGGLPITASKPASALGAPSASKKTSGNSRSQWKKCRSAATRRSAQATRGGCARGATSVRRESPARDRARVRRRGEAPSGQNHAAHQSVRGRLPPRQRSALAAERLELSLLRRTAARVSPGARARDAAARGRRAPGRPLRRRDRTAAGRAARPRGRNRPAWRTCATSARVAPMRLSPTARWWSRKVSGRSAASVASHSDSRANWTATGFRSTPKRHRSAMVRLNPARSGSPTSDGTASPSRRSARS